MAETRSAPLCLPPRPLQRRPRTVLPAGACDCHFHVFREGLPLAPERGYTPSMATLADWLALAAGVGLERGVVVQPSVSGTDNRALLEALAAHPGTLRGVVVIEPDTRPEEIARLLSPGGLRLDDVPRLAGLLRPLGWHLQVLLKPEQIETVAALRARHEVLLVIDHLAMIRPGHPLAPRAVDELQRLLDAPGVFVKVSAPYRLMEGAGYPGVGDIVARLAGSHPQRLLWGSDWPHTALTDAMPDEADLVDTVLDWMPDELLRHRVLVANPESVYWSS
jgi:predicted TIM-barrel fold metal-dependent hydrolase